MLVLAGKRWDGKTDLPEPVGQMKDERATHGARRTREAHGRGARARCKAGNASPAQTLLRGQPMRQPRYVRNRVESARLPKHGANATMPPKRYFFSSSLRSGAVCPGAAGLNGKLLNMFFAWFCICSCICTNMFFDCSI